MCGPSAGAKAINTQIQNFSKQVTSEAGTVFGDASSVFNNLIGGLQKIVNGGPSQQGFSQDEINARNASVVNNGATEARNLKGAAASGVAAIGGGNTVTPSGGNEATVMNAEQRAASDTATAENDVTQQNYEQGNKNYENAVSAEEKLPETLSVANGFNQTADSSQQDALKSQTSIDTASNWWQPLLMKGVTAGLGYATGGLSDLFHRTPATGVSSSNANNMPTNSGDSSGFAK